MHYGLTEFDSNFTQPKLISQTKDKEIYEFTIPPYSAGTQGEISYYIELKLDGHANRIEGYKKIKVGEYSSTTSANSFKTWDDGTGYVKGEVIDHVSGCEVDGACKLIVQTGNQKVALVYTEGDMQCLNTQAASWVNWGKNVNKGTVVKAYGSYKKLGSEQRLTFCDSKDYFILGENDPVPVGAYTEKFFDEVVERMGENEVKQNSVTIPTLFSGAKWQEVIFDPSKTMDFQMAYDDFKYIQEPAKRNQKFVQLPGHLWMATIKNLSDSQLNDTREKFQKYYDDSLKSTGWDWQQDLDSKHISFSGPSADGPLGSIWGYVKIQNEKLRLLGLGYQITDYTDVSNGGPIEIKCPCTLELKVFESDEVSVNNYSL